ncbi:hypothetical protein POVWA1_033320 [Plasmodium ovale wallikeri]|uniref:Uncharacterized protein n=1 Tax=Plasmodium ovale wallikeri TaxID=864142 RepID=A0A1A8YYE1_PLAOA|nr:hypothetical protein POVWA1_033320 [Plasmodium ovale wallikeri]
MKNELVNKLDERGDVKAETSSSKCQKIYGILNGIQRKNILINGNCCIFHLGYCAPVAIAPSNLQDRVGCSSQKFHPSKRGKIKLNVGRKNIGDLLDI